MSQLIFDGGMSSVENRSNSSLWLNRLGPNEISTALRIIESHMKRFPGEFESLATILRTRLAILNNNKKTSAGDQAT